MPPTFVNRLLAAALAVAVALLVSSSTAGATRVVPHVSSCGNSYPADGHIGPWRTTDVLHGNTLRVDCPSPSTHWDVKYCVQLISNGSGVNVFCIHRSGNGSPNDFSASEDQHPCSDSIYAFPLRTHVENNVTGGTINKPGGGSGVINLC